MRLTGCFEMRMTGLIDANTQLTADAWDEQMFFLASSGYRVIAHDRRGHGRSDQPWEGNDMDTYADDLAALTDGLTAQPHARLC